MNSKPRGVFLLNPGSYDVIYGPEDRQAIQARVEIDATCIAPNEWSNFPELTREVEIIFSGWGMPPIDEEFLKAFPKLKAVFYGAGSIRGFATEAFWKREIAATSAYYANAIPVAEFTVAEIVLATKSAWRLILQTKSEKRLANHYEKPINGMYGATIGLISLGMIGRMVAERLKHFDVKVIAYDPFITPEQAQCLGVEMRSLQEIFEQADVVSCHTPWLKETEGLLKKEHFAAMKPHATFINTSRGAVVNEADMIEVLSARPDLFALLDVTWPEPPVEGSPLYELPNVALTPHIAGSIGRECQRMGHFMVEELNRYLAGEPLKFGISHARFQTMA